MDHVWCVGLVSSSERRSCCLRAHLLAVCLHVSSAAPLWSQQPHCNYAQMCDFSFFLSLSVCASQLDGVQLLLPWLLQCLCGADWLHMEPDWQQRHTQCIVCQMWDRFTMSGLLSSNYNIGLGKGNKRNDIMLTDCYYGHNKLQIETFNRETTKTPLKRKHRLWNKRLIL